MCANNFPPPPAVNHPRSSDPRAAPGAPGTKRPATGVNQPKKRARGTHAPAHAAAGTRAHWARGGGRGPREARGRWACERERARRGGGRASRRREGSACGSERRAGGQGRGRGGGRGGAPDVSGALTHRPSPTAAAHATLHARLVSLPAARSAAPARASPRCHLRERDAPAGRGPATGQFRDVK